MYKLRQNVTNVADFLRDTRDRLTDLRGPMRAGARQLRAFLRKWYDSQGRGEWKKLSEWTLDNRRRRVGYYHGGGGGGKTLRWSGALRRSVFQKGAKGHVERVTPKSLVFGSDYELDGKPIGLWHDLGKPSRFPLPARRIFPIDVMFKELERTIHIQIQRSVGGFSPVGKRKR